MKKIFILLLLASNLKASDDWQFWLTNDLHIKFHEKIKGSIALMNRLKNDFSEYYYVHAEGTILFKIKGNNYFGSSYRQIYVKANDSQWDQEIRPTFILLNTLKAGFLHFSSRAKIISRIRKGKNNRGALKARLGLELLRTKYITAYANNEIFYHHNYDESRQIDRNRFSIGLKGKIKGGRGQALAWKTYYRRQDDKKSIGGSWNGSNVIGLGLGGKF